MATVIAPAIATESHSRLLMAPDLLCVQYGAAIRVSNQDVEALKDDDLMSVGEWLTFLRHMGLIDAGYLSVLQAKQIFIWSRIRSIAEGVSPHSDKAERNLRHLFYPDFLEALVRLSMTIALPTDFDVFEAGAAGAGATALVHLTASGLPLDCLWIASGLPLDGR
jgi:hypothetical protein